MTETQPQPPSRRYARYVLGIVLVMYTFNFLDRFILSILLQPVKLDLGLSDTQMGFLIGPAFAVLYTGLGVPIARLADRHSRRDILAIGFAVWSLMTALSGVAQSALQLTLARIGVGIGEAAGAAPAMSLLSDYFPPNARARALAVFQLGVYFGQALGQAAGGLLVGPIGWRWTFVVVGLPGLVFAALLRLTVKEPVRGAMDPPGERHASALEQNESEESGEPGFFELFRFLWGLRTFRYIALGGGLASFGGTGFGLWVPTLFTRVHEVSLAKVGVQYGLVGALAGMSGALLAGWLADRLGTASPSWMLRVPAAGALLSWPVLVAICLSPSFEWALVLAVPAGLLGAGWAPCVFSAVQNLVAPNMRALAASVLILFITLLGMGVAPQVIGIINDFLEPSFGVEAIRYSIAIVLSTVALGGLLMGLGSRSFEADLARARAAHR